METQIKYYLQKFLGFENYLFIFSMFKIFTLKYDKDERDFLHFLNLIKSDGVILDIGANIGLMSVTLAQRFKNSEIISFEPIPYNLKTLRKNVSFYSLKNVKIFDSALGNNNGKLKMVMPIQDSVKCHGLCHVVDERIPKQSKGEVFEINVNRLDDVEYLQKSQRPIVGLKIDVEHYESIVLEGGFELLKKYKPVIYCELADNDNRKKAFTLLSNLGYKAHVVKNNKLKEFDPENDKSLNFIFSAA